MLGDLLDSTRGYLLEGSLLTFLLNPVEIDSRRGWADFVAGGVGIHEEVAPSQDAFDFRVQHDEPFRRWIYSLHVAELTEEIHLRGIENTCARLSDPAKENLAKLVMWWDCTQQGLVAQAAHPVPKTNEDAWRLAESLVISGDQTSHGQVGKMLSRIANLTSQQPSLAVRS